jgi:hypothetical protein
VLGAFKTPQSAGEGNNAMTRIRSLVLAALSGLAVAGLVSPAGADIVTVTFSGQVHFSVDPEGVFGCTSTCSEEDDPYDGYTLTATYTFDTTEGMTQDTSTNKQVQGGSSFPPAVIRPCRRPVRWSVLRLSPSPTRFLRPIT